MSSVWGTFASSSIWVFKNNNSSCPICKSSIFEDSTEEATNIQTEKNRLKDIGELGQQYFDREEEEEKSPEDQEFSKIHSSSKIALNKTHLKEYCLPMPVTSIQTKSSSILLADVFYKILTSHEEIGHWKDKSNELIELLTDNGMPSQISLNFN